MKPQDLRIGNYIQDFEDKPYYFQIESIENNNGDYWVTYRDGSISCIVDALEPIPLTEEWLLKFGFEKIQFHIPDKYDNGKLRIKKDERGFWIIACYNFILITSVHQLQNLYFALTGEELTTQ